MTVTESRRVERRSAGGEVPRLERPVWFIAGASVALLLLVGARYGYHRDELYFLEASKHLAWGYVDQPPFSVAIAGLSRVLFGSSLEGLRFFPALAQGATVVLTAMIVRELGGGRFPQILGALAVAFGPVLIAANLAGPTVYDITAWTLVSLLLISLLRTGDERLWLVIGAVTGAGLLNKETILLLIAGVAIGFIVNRQARVLATPWLWAGVAIAVLMWSPNLLWQAQHGWTTLEMSRNLRQEHSGLGVSLKFYVIQLLLPGWWVAPVWMAGLWAFWRGERFRPYRAFAVAYVILFVLVDVFIGDRPYYFAALYMVLMAPGAIVTEGVVDGVRRFFSERRPRRRLIWRSRRAALAWVAVLSMVNLPLSLPILPASALAAVPLQKINYNVGEEIGWPDLVAEVAHVYLSLPQEQRSSVAIVTGNYGEAGAIDRYGSAFGLPRAYSGHNSYWWWGPPEPATGVTIAVGFDFRDSLTPYFGHVRLASRVHNAAGVDNDEEGEPIWLCTGQKRPWPAIWPSFKHYG